VYRGSGVANRKKKASMSEPHRVGSDLSKSVFQAHRASGDGLVEFRKKLRRDHVAPFFAELSRCRVAMEACASAHYWGRVIRFGEVSRVEAELPSSRGLGKNVLSPICRRARAGAHCRAMN